MKKERIKAEILDRLPERTKNALINLYQSDLQGSVFEHLKEIRVRANQPLLLITDTEELSVGRTPDTGEITEILQSLCKNSMYAFETSIKEGFVTVEGGHRIGLAGRYIEGKGIVNIGSLNIRISCEIKGCANSILPYLKRSGKDLYNTLILSPPCCGKTTLLRDLARSLSWSGFNIGVVDERSEIAGSYMGVSTNDMGPRCDIYDTCPKSTGIYMMLRAMSPDVIVTDEIGGSQDIAALRQASWAGVRLIASCHGFGEEDIKDSGLREIFDKVVVLSSRNGPGTVERIVQT